MRNQQTLHIQEFLFQSIEIEVLSQDTWCEMSKKIEKCFGKSKMKMLRNWENEIISKICVVFQTWESIILLMNGSCGRLLNFNIFT